MATQTQDKVLGALEACLEQERVALLDGDLDKIGLLLEEKSGLIDALNASGATHDDRLETLRGKAKRNQVLLSGALEGIRNVAKRLSELQSLRHSFDTYDQRGHRQTIEGQMPRSIEKRA